MSALQITVEPEVQLLSGAVQPYLFRSARGTLVVQSHAPYPLHYPLPPRNVFPGLPVTARSADGGHTWSLWTPGEGQGQGPIIEGAVLQFRDGRIRIFEWIADGPSPTGDFTGQFWDTSDEWQTVLGPTPFQIHLPQAKIGYDDVGKPYSGVTFHRSVVELLGGDLVACIYCWFHKDNIPSSYEPKMNRFRAVLLRSSDEGHTWRYVSTIAADPAIGTEGFDEPVLIQLTRGPRQGRLLCLMRTGNRVDPLYQSHSDDEGAHWSPPQPLPLRGVDPDLIEMADGTLACSFGYRLLSDPPAPDHGNYVAFSTDQGESWGQITHLPIEAHAGVYRSTCYTSLREVAPGKLLVTFDVGWWRLPIRYTGRRFVQVKQNATQTKHTMDRTPYSETFDDGPGGWCAWGTASLMPELKDGVLITRGPWRVDPNHSPPGAGYLHLLTYLYTHPTYYTEKFQTEVGVNRFLAGNKDRNLTNARMTVRLRGDVDLKGAKLTLWVQADIGDTRPNFVLTGQSLEVTPDWSEQTLVLSDDPAQWRCAGGRHDLTKLYGYGDIRDALKDVNCDLIIVLFPLNVVPLDAPYEQRDFLRTNRDYQPDYAYLPSGVIEFDTITIEYPEN